MIQTYFFRFIAFVIFSVVGCVSSPFAFGQVQFDDQQLEFFETKVRPLLAEKCYSCHGPESTPLEGGLNLASRSNILTGGDSGPAIVPGDPSESLIISAINYGDVYEMPPDTKMPQDEIDVLTKWVEMGAPWPKEEAVMPAENQPEFNLEKRKADHWCWHPVKQPALPKVKNTDWPTDPIDLFVLQKLESAGLEPAATADRRTLIRRMTFDITGMPPTPTEVAEFLDDDSPEAIEKLVDRLLASPRFGEHWARHWMDLVRYAETCGHEFDYPIPYAFQYRDYLIRAFNNDVPYDLLIREHIAGDLIAEPRRNPADEFNESLLGTGMWYFGEDVHGPVDVRADLAGHLDNQIDVMCKSFLGLTVACARCHDHKFDAISTEDYYALAGYLKSSRRQVAMLDPGRKIEKGLDSIQSRTREADQLLSAYLDSISNPDTTKLAQYLTAANEVLRNDPSWNEPRKTILHGETLKVISENSGTLETQEIKAQPGFAWKNDKQLWWRDGKIGDAIEIEVDSGDMSESTVELFANFTIAQDYGAAKILFNGKTLKPNQDFYSETLSTTNRMSLGQVRLNAGKNVLRFEITGHNEKAVPRNMIGVDYLELVAVEPAETAGEFTAEKVAEKLNIKSTLLKNLINAIKSEPLANKTHLLHELQLASKKKLVLDNESVLSAKSKLEQDSKEVQQSLDRTELFEDFNDGIPSDWSQTGFAFDSERRPGQFSVAGPWKIADGTVHSGRNGGRFQGVLRSPTFNIDHDAIHYRLRGENIEVRLIIEGYMMDVYNALLFAGMDVKLKDVPNFSWIVQSGDLPNHQGLRAHIEIIDQGDGWVELDEIRFSDKSNKAVDAKSRWFQKALANLSGEAVNIQGLGGSMALELAQLADSSDSTELTTWIIENRLGELFASSKEPIALRETENAGSPTALLEKQLYELRSTLSKEASKVPTPRFAIAMTDGTGEDEHIYIRGNHKALGQIAPRKFLTALDPDGQTIPAGQGSGRLKLANQIASAENPLTSRVITNRIWHHLMGRGIVASVDNFGVLGQPPTHPELLDYLATDFANNAWSVKKFIRKVMLSKTYQMASTTDEKATNIDPDNLLLHKANIKRITGESIRDSMLLASGELNEKMFGPPVKIHLTEFMQGRGRPGKSGPLDGDGRRSVYTEIRRNFLSPMMLAFDTPIPFNTTGRRNKSNVPSQALILMNDPLVIQLAEKWAERIVKDESTIDERVQQIYETAFAQVATTDDIARAKSFLEAQAKQLGVPHNEIASSVQLWHDYCHVIFNVKKFIYVY